MKKKLFCLLLVIGFLGVALVPLAAQAQEKAMKLRLSVMWPPQHPFTKLFDSWGKDVEKATNGRITVTVFAANTLSPPMQVYDNTVKGVVDVGTNLLAYSPGRLPLSEVLQQPLGYKSGYQGTKLANAYYQKFKPKEFDDVHVLVSPRCSAGFHIHEEPDEISCRPERTQDQG